MPPKKPSTTKPKTAATQPKPQRVDKTTKPKPKAPKQKRSHANGGSVQSYSGSSIYGYVYGNDKMEWSVKQTIDVNPLSVSSIGDDPLLKTTTQMWSRYSLEKFDIELIPVAGLSAVQGSTGVCGLWDNAADATGPKTVNTAHKTFSRDAAVGRRTVVPLPKPRYPREYTIDIGADPNEARPYFGFVGVAGPTTSVYSNQAFYPGALFQTKVHYRYTFYGPKDASERGRLLNVQLDGTQVALVEENGKAALITITGDTPAFLQLIGELRLEYSAAAAAGRIIPGRSVWSWIKKALLKLVDWATVVAPVLPDPWGVIVGGGAFMVGGILQLTPDTARVQSVSMQLFRTAEEQAVGIPIMSTATRTTMLSASSGTALIQVNHPEEVVTGTTTHVLPPEPIDPASMRIEEFGNPAIPQGSGTVWLSILCATKSGGTWPLKLDTAPAQAGPIKLKGGRHTGEWTLKDNHIVAMYYDADSTMVPATSAILAELSHSPGGIPFCRNSLENIIKANTTRGLEQQTAKDSEVYQTALQLVPTGDSGGSFTWQAGDEYVWSKTGEYDKPTQTLIISPTSLNVYYWNMQVGQTGIPAVWEVLTTPATRTGPEQSARDGAVGWSTTNCSCDLYDLLGHDEVDAHPVRRREIPSPPPADDDSDSGEETTDDSGSSESDE
uniref:Capsid protein n=1 Tax=Wenling rattails astrovirus 4 TaxID=2116138 RepID=A0A2P1GME0_9VIRU|nr:capsid protein [Wenling rattails astrovirus 4]